MHNEPEILNGQYREALRRILEIAYKGHPDGRETRLELISRYAGLALGAVPPYPEPPLADEKLG